jgi:alanyl-tRNA synthetase
VVTIGDQDDTVSMELCGGTHVDTTAEIGSLRVVSEGSVAAGVRRIEAVTGRVAESLVERRLTALEAAAGVLKIKPEEIDQAVEQLQVQQKELQQELAQLRQKLTQQSTQSLLDQAVQMDGLSVLSVQVEADNVDTLRQMTDWFRDKLGSSVVMVGSIIDDKPMLVAAATSDVVKRGVHAGNLVRDAARIIGGGGGGRPNMAQAGGRDSSKLDEALQSVPAWVEQHLEK